MFFSEILNIHLYFPKICVKSSYTALITVIWEQ